MTDRGVLIQGLSPRLSVALGPIREGNRALANATVAAGTNATMVIDTMISPALMVEARTEAERLGAGRPVAYLLNSHGDADHLLGNGLFPDAEVIAHRTVRDLFADPESRARYESVMANQAKGHEGSELAASFVLRPPDTIFENEILVDLGGLTALCSYVGPAHSVADSIVWLEQESAVVAADLVFNGAFPLLRHDLDRWFAGLALASSYRPAVVVPGHGPVGDALLLERQREVLERILEAARGLHAAAVPIDLAVEQPVPASLATLALAAERWPGTLRAAYAYLTGKAAVS